MGVLDGLPVIQHSWEVGGGGHFEMTLVKAVEDAATALSLPQHPTGGQGVGQEAVGITGHVKGGGVMLKLVVHSGTEGAAKMR